MRSDNIQTEAELIAARVHELMDRHGVKRRAHAADLSRILNLSFSTASRKLNGQFPWTLSQLTAVASEYGESPATLIDGLDGAERVAPKGKPYDARFIVSENREYACIAWIDDAHYANSGSALVAVKFGNRWHIYDAEDAPASDHHPVHMLQLEGTPAERDKLRVAVIDDARILTDSICDYLNGQGFAAIPFYDDLMFRAALHDQAFDGVIVDWLLGASTAENAIMAVRNSENPDAPIFLLTGRVQTGEVTEDEVVRIMRKFNVRPFIKGDSLRLAFLVEELRSQINARV